MICQTNKEIRFFLETARLRRAAEGEIRKPMGYLDWMLGRLEGFHLAGRTHVPREFFEHLERVEGLLPQGVTPPRRWRDRINAAIEQCFQLQEQLLRSKRSRQGGWRDRPGWDEDADLCVPTFQVASRGDVWRTARVSDRVAGAARWRV